MSTSASKTERDRPIQLKWDAGTVVITPEDENRFVKESKWAVTACQNQLAAERFVEQFKSEFLARVHEWCQEHDDRVLAAYVALTSQHLQVFVVSRLGRYDFSLSDDVSDLESELFEKNWPCEIVQIPAGSIESLQTFFDPERSIEVYGDAIGTVS